MFAMTTYEKVATIVQCRASGALGTFHAFEQGPAECPYPAGYRVEADGLCFIVRGHRIGWEVRFGGFAAIDADLEEATRLALEAGRGRNACAIEQALGLERVP